MKTFREILGLIVKSVIAGLAIAFVILKFWPENPVVSLQDNPNRNGNAPLQSFAEAVNKAAPSVVSIYTKTLVSRQLTPLQQRIIGRRAVAREVQGLGSGVIVSPDGYIVTNYHVIRNSTDIRVALWDGRIAEPIIIGEDIDTDLAVLKIDLDDLPVATATSTDNLRVGDVVLAIGNAAGLNHTVTQGIISALGRDQIRGPALQDFIQTDAAINTGNSGGALVNSRGELIGINTAALGRDSGAQSIGFAIPFSLVRQVMEQIVNYGDVRRGWLGAEFSDLPLGNLNDGSRARPHGVYLKSVVRNGPAWQANLRAGDIIHSFNGKDVPNARQLLLEISRTPPGTEVEITFSRGNILSTNRARLAQQPPPS